MANFKTLGSLLLVAALLAPAAAAASPPSGCSFEGQHITKVTPYEVTQPAGRAAVKKLAGAVVYVQAQPGVTAEWLELKLTQHLAKMQHQGMANCPLRNGVKVSVESAGTGFAVKLVAKEGTSPREVLQLARGLAQ